MPPHSEVTSPYHLTKDVIITTVSPDLGGPGPAPGRGNRAGLRVSKADLAQLDEHPVPLSRVARLFAPHALPMAVVLGLTRAGVVAAFNELQNVDTGGLVVPINGFETGVSRSCSGSSAASSPSPS